MTAQLGATPVEVSSRPATDSARLYQEGMIAGVLGASAIALWFLLIDALAGRPLYTPSLLGTALFRRSAALASPETLAVSLEMVLMFTWMHGMVFAALGGVAARLLGLAERNASLGFGILLLFVVFQFGFVAAATVFATPALRALSPLGILVANLLAAAVMTAYFRHRHPHLMISP